MSGASLDSLDIEDCEEAAHSEQTNEKECLKNDEPEFVSRNKTHNQETPPDNADKDSNSSNDSASNKKRVSFPETLIISFLEPPDPWSWRHVIPCTEDQVVNAYKRSCEAHGIKPLPKVLQQLKAIEDYNIRSELFTVKGERLDQRHIETLEEVLKRVQFKLVDLEATHLDDEGAISLFDMIEYYESACKVNLAFNRNIGFRGWFACSKMLKKTPCMEYLDVRNCCLNEQTMPVLGRSLRLGSVLTTLHMENCNISGRPLMILVAALKLNEPLRELFLADNGLMPSDAIQLGNLLKFNHKLYLLDLRNNHLQDVGLSHLCDGLFEQNMDSGLNTLVLWNNQITFQGMVVLTRALLSTKSLQTLNLGHNHLTSEGIYKLKDGILGNSSLLRIGLQGCRLACEAAIALAEFIADSPRLLRIDLRDNDIKTAGLMALAQGLRHCKTTTRLDLDKNAKKENGVKDYAEQQKFWQEEIANVLEINKGEIVRQEVLKLEEQQKAQEIHDKCKECPGNDENQLELPSVPTSQSLLESPGVEVGNRKWSFGICQNPEPVTSADDVSVANPQANESVPSAAQQFINTTSSVQQPVQQFINTTSSVKQPVIPNPPLVPPAPPLPAQRKRKLFTVKKVSLSQVPGNTRNSSVGDSKDAEKSLIDHIVQFSSSKQEVTIVKKEADESSDVDESQKCMNENNSIESVQTDDHGLKLVERTPYNNSNENNSVIRTTDTIAAYVDGYRTSTNIPEEITPDNNSNDNLLVDAVKEKANKSLDDADESHKSTCDSTKGVKDNISNTEKVCGDVQHIGNISASRDKVPESVETVLPNLPAQSVANSVINNISSSNSAGQSQHKCNVDNQMNSTEAMTTPGNDLSQAEEPISRPITNLKNQERTESENDPVTDSENQSQQQTLSQSPDSGFQEEMSEESLKMTDSAHNDKFQDVTEKASVSLTEHQFTELVRRYVEDVVQTAYCTCTNSHNKIKCKSTSSDSHSKFGHLQNLSDNTMPNHNMPSDNSHNNTTPSRTTTELSANESVISNPLTLNTMSSKQQSGILQVTDSGCSLQVGNSVAVNITSTNQHCSSPDQERTKLSVAENNATPMKNCKELHADTKAVASSPNFHSDFSQHNMSEELASAIDSDGVNDNMITADDFEKELDDMLATVQSGILFPHLH